MDHRPFRLPRPDPKSAMTNLVTREMVRTRSHELVQRAGREPSEVTHRDYSQARQELTGESDLDRQEARMDWTA